jgi:hypothetical protein
MKVEVFLWGSNSLRSANFHFYYLKAVITKKIVDSERNNINV